MTIVDGAESAGDALDGLRSSSVEVVELSDDDSWPSDTLEETTALRAYPDGSAVMLAKTAGGGVAVRSAVPTTPLDVLEEMWKLVAGSYSTMQGDFVVMQDLATWYYANPGKTAEPIVPNYQGIPRLSDFNSYADWYEFTNERYPWTAVYQLKTVDGANWSSGNTAAFVYFHEWAEYYGYHGEQTSGTPGATGLLGEGPYTLEPVTGCWNNRFDSSRPVAGTTYSLSLASFNYYNNICGQYPYHVLLVWYHNGGIYGSLYCSTQPISESYVTAKSVYSSAPENRYLFSLTTSGQWCQLHVSRFSNTAVYPSNAGEVTFGSPFSEGYNNAPYYVIVNNDSSNRASSQIGWYGAYSYGGSTTVTTPAVDPPWPQPGPDTIRPVPDDQPTGDTYITNNYNNTTNATTTVDLQPILDAIEEFNTSFNVFAQTVEENFQTFSDNLQAWQEWWGDYFTDWMDVLHKDLQRTNRWLESIFYKLPGGSSSEPDPSVDDDGWWEWLGDLIDKLLGQLPEGVADFTAALSQLTGKFPFSVPWDMSFMLGLLSHSPITPRFSLWLPGMSGGHWVAQGTELDIDLSPFDGAAQVCRRCEFLLFALGLTKWTIEGLKGIDWALFD